MYTCFVHIEKTAGMTLHRILGRNFSTYLRASPYVVSPDMLGNEPSIPRSEVRQMAKLLPLMNAFGGHGFRRYEAYEVDLGPVFYLTFLRNPIRRFLSHRWYQNEVMERNWTLRQFCSCDALRNFMCRRIAGVPSFDAAAEALEQFDFVGLTEQFDRSLIALEAALQSRGQFGEDGLRLWYESENVRRRRSSACGERITDVEMRMVREANADDIKLYDFAKRLTERRFDAIRQHLPSRRREDFEIGKISEQKPPASKLFFLTARERMLRAGYIAYEWAAGARKL